MIIKFLEFKQEDLEPVKSFHVKETLNPKVWDNFEIKDEIREQLLKIAQDYWNSLELEADVKNIILTGSLANYNWDNKYSDFDLHIVIDFRDIDDNVELVKKYLDESKKNWNDLHDIKIQGFDVEIYVQDENEPHTSSGIFSLLNNKWIVKPTKKDFEPDEKMISDKSKSIMLKIDSLEESIDNISHDEFDRKAMKIWKKIKDLRKQSMEEGNEFGLGNLIFKTLRRNNYIKKIIDLKRKSYDQQFK